MTYPIAMMVRSQPVRTIPKWADALRKRREELGLTQERVAALSNYALAQRTVSDLERGITKPTSLTTPRFAQYLRALGWSVEDFAGATGIKLPGFIEPKQGFKNVLSEVSHLEVHPDWLMFPVYASVSAGDRDPSPIDGEVAYFPAEKLRAKGVKPSFVRFYLVNGDCMISDEVRLIEKNIAPHDYIAVDTEHRPRPGDVVVAWWRDEEKLVLTLPMPKGRGFSA